MLKNIQKIVNSKSFLITVLFICLMFTSVGVNVENSYAVDFNESGDLGLDIDVEDKLENSQEDQMVLLNSNENNRLGQNIQVNQGTFDDIRTAISRANNDDTIELNGNFASGSSDDVIVVNKRLTFTSSSQATLDAQNQCTIFKITSGGAQSTFKNLKFVNGHTSERGGAVFVSAKLVTFDNCVFENNHADATAGAIHTPYNAETSKGLTIKNCNFTGNYATVAAGAVGAFSHDFLIENCIFDSNHVDYDGECYGGAIQIGLDTMPSYGTVRNCLFINNQANSKTGLSHGGAGCVRNGSSYYNCIFINNSADHGGALTYHASGNLNNCTLINNTANKYGGGVSILMNYLDFMNLNIINSVFKGNEAPLGGAVKLDGSNIKIEDSTFEDNFASQYGGAVNINASNVKVIDSDFRRNIANIDGGALYLKGDDTTIRNSKFIANEAIPDVNKLNDGLGGAIYVNSTRVLVQDNDFEFNTARNGSAIYFDKKGVELKLQNNTLFQNQAWVYHLPISAHDIYYGDVENIKSVIYGGNNIGDYDNLAVSNAIYNAANYDKIEIDGEHPVLGATNSGKLYQDDREYKMDILMTVKHEDGTVVYNKSLNSNYLGEVSDNLTNLKPGKYYVTAKHFEDNYYKAITNATVFNVIPKTDNKILKSTAKSKVDYDDYVVWTLNITNNGPNDATGVIVRDILPEGLIWDSDDSNGAYNAKTGVLTIGSLKVGQKMIVNIITKVNKTGVIINNANVTGNEFDVNLTNNHDESQINVAPAVDVGVVKSVNVTNPNYGDVVRWTLTVSNVGPDVAHDVKVNDVLPESLVFVSCDGNYDNNTGVWNVGTLGVNKSVRLNIVSRVCATGKTTNEANVTSREFDYNLANNHAERSINVAPAVDVAIAKAVNVSNPNYGDVVRWTLTVSNVGPDVAHDVKVSDVLPESLVFVSCDGNYDNGTGVWNVGTLGVNKSVRLNIVSRVCATGKTTNEANVTSREFDYNLANNHAKKSINVDPAADMEVIKLVNNSNPNFMDSVEWTITVKNNGPDNAHDVKLMDVLPKSLIWINDDSNGKYNPNTGIWNLGELNSKTSIKLTIITQVNATGNITNNASVSAREFDYNMKNNNDSENISINKSGDLAILKMVNVSNPNYGDLIKWTLIASNNGPDKVNDVIVEDILPKGLELINYTASKGFYDNGMWSVCCLENGETQRLEIICRVNKTGKITNVAEISGNEYDPVLTNNVDDESIDVPLAADMALTKKVSDENPYFGDVVFWMIGVKNLGPDKATNIRIADELPDGLIFKEYKSSRGIYQNGIWSFDYLNKGDAEYLNISCYVNKLGIILNNATVTANEYDINKSNNHDYDIINAAPVADLAIEKLVNTSNANYQDLVEWELIVSNQGYNDATGVIVKDILPDSLEIIEIFGDGEYIDDAWNIGDLEVGGYRYLHIITRIIETGNITNSAIVKGNEMDPDLSNNEAENSVHVYPAADLSIIKTVSKYRYHVGDSITYTLKISNNGPDDAVNVKVNEIFDKSLVLKSVKATKGNFDVSNNQWSLDDLAAGGEEKLLVEFEAIKEGVFENFASVLSDTFDHDLTNNDDFVFVKIVKNITKSSNIVPNNSSFDLIDHKLVKAKNIPHLASNLQKNPTANLIALLIVSTLVSIIFGGSGII